MDFNTVLLSVGDKLPKDGVSAVMLKDKFERLSEDKQKEVATQLPLLNLKSPALVFWVGTFLLGSLGVGRFMIGDWVLGLVRLGLTIVGIICDVLAFEYKFLGIVGGCVYLTNWIWWIVDMFLVGKKLRRQNCEKIANLMN